ncbi:MAG: sugar ABC transporter permease [Clostridiales bacterium]|nr:sugar ABC transporter permease [Clostridiales bacterium]
MTDQYRGPGLFKRVGAHWVSYLFLLPFAGAFAVFTVLPVCISFVNSLTRYSMLEPPVFVGFDNYVRMFTDDEVFQLAMKNTIFLALIIGPGGYLASLLLAWMINTLPRSLRTVFVVVFYAPASVPGIYSIWKIIFSGDEYGLVNGFLKRWGFVTEPISFLYDPTKMMMVLIICQLWISMGIGFLSFVAGLKSIDRQYYEAAAVDGVKNRWQEAWFITLPMLKPQLLFGAIMAITGSFGISEVTVQLFGFPSTDYTVHTMANHLSDHFSIRYDVGYASSIATVMFCLMIGCNKLVNRLLGRVGR